MYIKIAAAFCWYLVMFKLNFKLGCCCSILNTFSNNVSYGMFWSSMKLPFQKKKTWIQILGKRERCKKVMNVYKCLEKSFYCTKAVLNRHSDTFYLAEISAFILEIKFFSSVSFGKSWISVCIEGFISKIFIMKQSCSVHR